MSGAAALDEIYSGIEESARLLGVPCDRARVWPILSAYEEAIPSAVVAFRVTTGASHIGELDYRFMMLPKDVDPYALALAHGFAAKTDHPVGALLGELEQRYPIDTYGADFGVVGGFKKTYSFFPADDMQHLRSLAEVPSMPRGVGENVELFARYGLDDRTSLVGVDYQHRTMNLYFGEIPTECFTRENVQAMVGELGLPAPSERLLGLAEQAFGIYVTLSWDSPRVERICYAVMTPDPLSLQSGIDPKIEQFVRTVERDTEANRFVYAGTRSTSEEYYKLQSYFQWRPQILDVMLLTDRES